MAPLLVSSRATRLRSATLLATAVAVAGAAFAQETITHIYDARGRLVEVDHSGTVNNGLSSSYSYDKADNRTNVTVTGAGPQTPTFSVSDASVDEGGTLTFTVSKAGTASGPLTVDYATADGTALAGSDYTATSGTLTFAANDTSLTVQVVSSDDSAVEPDENFTLNLSNTAVGSLIGDGQGVGTIRNNDVPPSFAINDASVTEGGILGFTVTRSGPTGGGLSVDFASANGTATAGSDYTATSGTLTFDPGVTSLPVNVSTTDDTASEGSETLSVNLGNASGGAQITDGQGTGTITDNDATGLSINDVSVTEGGNLIFTVTLTGTPSGSVSVQYATADGTAVERPLSQSDYRSSIGILNFPVGQTNKTIVVATREDVSNESDETLFVNLSNATGANIVDAQGVGTIIDND